MPKSPWPGIGRPAVAFLVLVIAGFGLAMEAFGDTAPLESTVVVQPGDTLWGIASAHYPGADPRERVDAIERLNGLDSPVIEAGETLRLPA
jgi:LysM repeat protein